ncbi:MAG: ferritin [bacterium]
MISDELANALDEQMHEEFGAASAYLGMAAWLDAEDWDGFAHFMKAQSMEEVEHAMKIYEFLYEVGHRAHIPGLEQPQNSFGSVEDVFQTALEHEERMTENFNELDELAEENQDRSARTLINWFIDEQIEEENLMGDILTKIERVGDDPTGLMILDEELGERPMTGENPGG